MSDDLSDPFAAHRNRLQHAALRSSKRVARRARPVLFGGSGIELVYESDRLATRLWQEYWAYCKPEYDAEDITP